MVEKASMRLRCRCSTALAPPTGSGSGFTIAKVPDLLGALGNAGRFARLPGDLAGYPRAPQVPGLPQIARYGTGLTSFVALALPANIAEISDMVKRLFKQRA